MESQKLCPTAFIRKGGGQLKQRSFKSREHINVKVVFNLTINMIKGSIDFKKKFS